MSRWTTVLSPDQIEDHFRRFAEVMPEMAARVRAEWEAMTLAELCAARHQAWNTNEDDRYQMANSFIAIREKEAAA